MKFHTIVTHPGQAHRDDFIACCIAIALFRPDLKRIERRDPTAEELDDPNILVLDVGEQYDPSKGNFDHHQLPREAPATCCLSMFLQAIEKYDSFKLMDWVESTEIMDSKGPFALASHLGCEPDAIFRNLSPVEGALIEMFGQETKIDGELGILWGMMLRLGRQFIQHAEELQTQMDWLKANAQATALQDVTVLVIENDNTKSVQKFRDTYHPEAAICISHDDRGDGWSLYRFNDHPKVDFSRLEGRDEILFAHKGGFIAKTKKRMSIEDALLLCGAALL